LSGTSGGWPRSAFAPSFAPPGVGVASPSTCLAFARHLLSICYAVGFLLSLTRFLSALIQLLRGFCRHKLSWLRFGVRFERRFEPRFGGGAIQVLCRCHPDIDRFHAPGVFLSWPLCRSAHAGAYHLIWVQWFGPDLAQVRPQGFDLVKIIRPGWRVVWRIEQALKKGPFPARVV